MRFLARLFLLAAVAALPASAAQKDALPPPTEKRVYKEVDGKRLEIWIWKPADWKASDQRSAIVFYHGGGWRGGSPTAFSRQSARLAERGMVAFSVQYRLVSQPGVTVVNCVEDAKSAYRWVRAQARELGVDPAKIAAGGGSAGGHLAAALATLDSINDARDNAQIPTRPVALVLFNPAAKLGGLRTEPDQRFRDTAAVAAVDPYEHVKKGHPPTIIFHGENDTTVPIASVRAYAAKVESLGDRCQVVGTPGQAHSFFNKEPFVWDTLKQAEAFLEREGLLRPAAVANRAAR